MQVPRFSPRISLIEMAPRAAPRSGCLGRPTLPCPVCHQLHREWAVLERIFQALPTKRNTTVALIYKIILNCPYKWSCLHICNKVCIRAPPPHMHNRMCTVSSIKHYMFNSGIIKQCTLWWKEHLDEEKNL
jgi:hypothetical protein